MELKNIKKNFLVITLTFLFIFTVIPVYALEQENDLNNKKDIQILRIAGEDRYRTSIKIAKSSYKKNDTIFITSGENFTDALYGGPLVSLKNSSLILSPKDKLTKDIKDTLASLDTKNITILGGIDSISLNIESELKKSGFIVNRISGKNRFETADLINKEKINTYFGTVGEDDVSLSNGYMFADSLCAGPFIYYNDKFNPTRFLPYNEINASHGAKYVFGGLNSVPQLTSEENRLSGKDRYETSLKIANEIKKLLPNQEIKTLVIASGTDFPDSLSSIPLTTHSRGVLILSKKDSLGKEIMNFISENKSIQDIIIVGGENSLSKNIEKELYEICNHRQEEK